MPATVQTLLKLIQLKNQAVASAKLLKHLPKHHTQRRAAAREIRDWRAKYRRACREVTGQPLPAKKAGV